MYKAMQLAINETLIFVRKKLGRGERMGGRERKRLGGRENERKRE